MNFVHVSIKRGEKAEFVHITDCVIKSHTG